MANVDLTPGANPVALGGPGIHFHNPGHSASEFNNSSDFPSVPANSNASKGTKVTVTGTPGAVVRFASPA